MKKELTAREMQSKGGKARVSSMSKEELKAHMVMMGKKSGENKRAKKLLTGKVDIN